MRKTLLVAYPFVSFLAYQAVKAYDRLYGGLPANFYSIFFLVVIVGFIALATDGKKR
jgi:hypothetical protein